MSASVDELRRMERRRRPDSSPVMMAPIVAGRPRPGQVLHNMWITLWMTVRWEA